MINAMNTQQPRRCAWEQIETVLFDLDGTLLDLHFDNQFWLDYLPRSYAAARSLSVGEAKTQLLAQYDALRGTLDWYCVDYWTQTLELDIIGLKQQLAHLIAPHPGVGELLTTLGQLGKRRVLVTNAHPHSLELKMRHTQLGDHFEQMVSAHDLKLAKETAEFWHELARIEPFNPQTTVLVDDNLDVLEQAAAHGLRWLIAVRQPDSQRPPVPPPQFPSVHGVGELLAELAGGT